MGEEQTWYSQEATRPSKAPVCLSALLLEQVGHCLADLPWSRFQKSEVRGQMVWVLRFSDPVLLYPQVCGVGSAESCPGGQPADDGHPGHSAGSS